MCTSLSFLTFTCQLLTAQFTLKFTPFSVQLPALGGFHPPAVGNPELPHAPLLVPVSRGWARLMPPPCSSRAASHCHFHPTKRMSLHSWGWAGSERQQGWGSPEAPKELPWVGELEGSLWEESHAGFRHLPLLVFRTSLLVMSSSLVLKRLRMLVFGSL